MITVSNTPSRADAMELHSGPTARVLILEAPYYAEITSALIEGASLVLEEAKTPYDRFEVPGALEIPQAFRLAVYKGLFGGEGRAAKYHGVIVLGCVIRGETSHYDIVCNNANHWLMKTAIDHTIPLGNAILTVDTEAQALARAKGGRTGKGADAARACLRLIWLNSLFGRDGA